MSRTNTAMAQRPINSNPFAEPDVLTPYQFFKVFRQKGHMDPEEKLMFAVLTMLSNLLTDVAYVRLDPRIRLD